jgi:hypothetical protein
VARKRREDLLAVDDPAALDGPGLGAERDATGRRRATFRERLRINRAVLDDAPVMHGAPALVFRAGLGVHIEIVGQRSGPQRRADVHIPGQRGRAAIAADLGGGQSISLVAGAETAVLLRNGDAEQSRAMQIQIILAREFGFTIVRRSAAGEHGLA